MQLTIPGKPELEIRLLQESDHEKLLDFCNTCKELGWQNNDSFKTIKLDKMLMPHGQYFIGYDYSKVVIWNLAGVHQFPEIGPSAWRCLFRGAQLPGYTLTSGLTKDMFKIGFHLSYFLPMQIKFIKEQYPNSEFYMTSNTKSNETYFAKSQQLDSGIMPRLASRGVFKRTHENFMLYNTIQSVWQIQEDTYWEQRNKVLPVDIL
jgi:hypothetical protein